ncbi:DUF4199 family protein [Gracilimonas sp.]|uniref:DUF4199 family protein n=1 Tax=Gracilimonas sp. TaxID=1974203 RepID=UPI002870B628|nr:DUF4199 family protein [Gracilimonas sp.]
MENEQVQPSYWNSVIIASLMVGIVVSLFSIIGGYMMLGNEPDGAMFNSSQLFQALGCLIGAFGGIFVNWHYAKGYDITYKIGKGALLGLLVGLIGTIFTVAITQLWNVIDPSYQEALMEWSRQNVEAMQMTAEMKEQMMARMEDPYSLSNIAIGALTMFAGLGILNVISGLIGAKVFASEE